tara:strand:- start:10 stop:237 length:228 start_codon:yes stop_codon:yes gene_type:complete
LNADEAAHSLLRAISSVVERLPYKQDVPGSNPGSPISLLEGLKLNYFGDLSGGRFLMSPPDGVESCSCGSGFRYL